MQPIIRIKSSFACGLLFLIACSDQKSQFASAGNSATACLVDEDGDGYGVGCALGDDCDDEDSESSNECRVCAKANEGCACVEGTAAMACFTQKASDHDTLICTNGERFCRDGVWSACQGANVFEVSRAQMRSGILERAVVGDAGTQPCSPCSPGCFPITDPVDPQSGPLNSSNSISAAYAPGGGVTVEYETVGIPQVIDTGMPCTQMGAPADADCDGIPDLADAVTGPNSGYATTRATIFMDLVPGESESATVTLPVKLRSADVYFLIDGSESMAGLSAQLATTITSGNYLDGSSTCADTDLDGVANDELKTQGLAGNVNCLLPGSEFGAGWVREIPFLGPDANSNTFGDIDEHMFEHRVDIGSTASTLSGALARFGIDTNHAGGNAQMQGLRLLANGQESYVGWDRPALPSRVDCPASTFGYACFRASALPVVVLFTAEPMHNGPSTASGDLGAGVPNSYPGSIHSQEVHAGTYPHYLPVPATNEAYGSAFNTAGQLINGAPLASISNDLVTFTGSTENMAADVDAELLGCPGLSATGSEAVFRFNVNERKTLSLSTQGTRFDSVLGVVRAGAPITSGTPSNLTFDFRTPAGAGDGAPNQLGSLPQGVSAAVIGNSAGANADYPREILGCYENASFTPSADSTDFAPDVAFRFNLDADMDLSFQVPADASVKSLSLFQGQPSLEDVVVPANAEQITLARDISQAALRLISGTSGAGATRNGETLSTAGLSADIPASLFAAAGCTPAGALQASPDSVVNFSLSRPTHVRIETSGNAQGMGASFEHMLGLSRRDNAVSPVDHPLADTSNETLATAHDIDEADFATGGWARVTGSVWNANSASLMNADYVQAQVGGTTGCGLRGGGDDASPDAVFSFTLDRARTLEIDTENSSYRTFLSLHHARDITTDNQNDTQATARPLGTLNAKQWTVRGSTNVPTITQNYSRIQRSAIPVNGVRPTPRSLGCNAESPDAVYSFTLSQATDVRVDTQGSDYDTLLGVYDSRGPEYFEIDNDLYDYPGTLACNDDYGGVTTSQIVLNNLPAGTYYVVVAGWDVSRGDYELRLTDLRATTFDPMPLIACDSGSLPLDTERSRIVQRLDAGTYYLVLKGDASQVSPDYYYELNIREVVEPDALIACGYRNAGNPGSERATIDEVLPAGAYSVTVRGAHASDAGSYRLMIRDADFSPPQLGCHDTKLGDAPAFTRSLAARNGSGAAIDYWLVLRGFDANAATPGSDPYQMYIRDANLGIPLDACAQAAQGNYTGTFEPGDYYAVVKGRTTNDKGWYQLSLGDPNLVSPADYTDLASYGAARDALTSNGFRVIGAQVGTDANLGEQLASLASDTGAVDETNRPLVVQVSATDPQLASSLGTKVVAALQKLSAALRMNVGLRLDPGPSNPPKPFTFSYSAVDKAGDGCAPPVNQIHQDCGAGATPEFSVTFTNPNAPGAVPPNPSDPNGGYYMTLELVGDGRYVLERIPVYIVPSDIAPERPRTTYNASGRYWQDLESPNCLANERPTWNSLRWDAVLPTGTSIAWKVCGSESKQELGVCPLRTLATVTAGGACAQDPDCQDGFCAGNVCQFAVGPACDSDADCGTNGVCPSGTCRWTGLPIDPAPALDAEDRRYLRMELEMTSSSDKLSAPVVYDWQVQYDCGAAE